jgi:circadian clock protein KaiC
LKNELLKKIETNIEGFDHISKGGIPKNRTTLICGSAGSGKTIFAAQFLIEGIQNSDENGVFITFEEKPDDVRKNMRGFGWDINKLEEEKKWAFVDVSPQLGQEQILSGDYELKPLLARIEYAVDKVNAKRISIDSIGALLLRFSNSSKIRSELFQITQPLKNMKVSVVMTAERIKEYGNISRFNVEEFVADNVIILRNLLERGKRRRTIEILKYRGTNHRKGEFPFTITSGKGIIVIPLSAMELKQGSSKVRLSSGNKELDKMVGGGFFSDSIILVSGATGTGKTLIMSEFMAKGIMNGQRCLLFAFEESKDQLFRNALGWGINFRQMEKEGKLKIICQYPEFASLEDHLINIKNKIRDFNPDRMGIDSLSALKRIGTSKAFREFSIGLTSFIKRREIAGFITATTPYLTGGLSIAETQISTLTDTIILLRYVEMYGEMHRGIIVLKMRGSRHDKNIREVIIDDNGMHIGEPIRNVVGILRGRPKNINPSNMSSIKSEFNEK